MWGGRRDPKQDTNHYVPLYPHAALPPLFSPTNSSSLYGFTVKDASGQDYNLGQQLKGKKAVLVVNVASQCTCEGRRRWEGGREGEWTCEFALHFLDFYSASSREIILWLLLWSLSFFSSL